MVAPNLFGQLDKIIKSVAPATVNYGKEIANHVRNRTRNQGVTMYGNQFKPYSSAYAARKKGGRVAPVTLTDTKRMLDSIKVRNKQAVLDSNGKLEIEVGPVGVENIRIAQNHQFGIGVPTRPFMGVTPEEQRELLRVFDDAMYRPVSTKDEIIYKL
jgi:phage gpG-like protein